MLTEQWAVTDDQVAMAGLTYAAPGSVVPAGMSAFAGMHTPPHFFARSCLRAGVGCERGRRDRGSPVQDVSSMRRMASGSGLILSDISSVNPPRRSTKVDRRLSMG